MGSVRGPLCICSDGSGRMLRFWNGVLLITKEEAATQIYTLAVTVALPITNEILGRSYNFSPLLGSFSGPLCLCSDCSGRMLRCCTGLLRKTEPETAEPPPGLEDTVRSRVTNEILERFYNFSPLLGRFSGPLCLCSDCFGRILG